MQLTRDSKLNCFNGSASTSPIKIGKVNMHDDEDGMFEECSIYTVYSAIFVEMSM